MPSSIKASYQQTYEGDTAGIAGDLEAIKGGIDKVNASAGGPPAQVCLHNKSRRR